MPCRPSVSTSSTDRPSAARARARAAATVVLPVPPFPVTTCRRAVRSATGAGLTRTSLGAVLGGGPPARWPIPRPRPALASSAMSEPARRRWEYATIPLLVHNTKAILDSWGVDGWELVTVLPGPGGTDQLVAYLKRQA